MNTDTHKSGVRRSYWAVLPLLFTTGLRKVCMYKNLGDSGLSQVKNNVNSEIRDAVSNVFEYHSWKIEVSASRQAEEPHRIARLHRVIGFAHALSKNFGNESLLSKVRSLHDHKGDLTIKWRSAPMPGEMDIFNLAWCDSTIGDGWGSIRHFNSSGQEISFYGGPGFDFDDLFTPMHNDRGEDTDDSLVA